MTVPPGAGVDQHDRVYRVDHSDTCGVSDRLFTAEEIAHLLSVPERWVREHTRSGLIPHLRLGRYVRYRQESVMARLADQEQGGAAWRKHHPVPATGTKCS